MGSQKAEESDRDLECPWDERLETWKEEEWVPESVIAMVPL
jgi:hypothetical protein